MPFGRSVDAGALPVTLRVQRFLSRPAGGGGDPTGHGTIQPAGSTIRFLFTPTLGRVTLETRSIVSGGAVPFRFTLPAPQPLFRQTAFDLAPFAVVLIGPSQGRSVTVLCLSVTEVNSIRHISQC